MLTAFGAQSQGKLGFGVQGGINYPDVRGFELAKYNNFKAGFLFGATFEYELGAQISLRADLNFERKVGRTRVTYFDENAVQSGTEEFRRLQNYINLPLMFKYEVGRTPLFINGGGFFNYLLSAKYKPEYPSEAEETSQLTPEKNVDLGVTLGVGAQFGLGANQLLMVEVRNDLGLVDTGRVPLHLEGGSRLTNTIKLVLGYRFL